MRGSCELYEGEGEGLGVEEGGVEGEGEGEGTVAVRPSQPAPSCRVTSARPSRVVPRSAWLGLGLGLGLGLLHSSAPLRHFGCKSTSEEIASALTAKTIQILLSISKKKKWIQQSCYEVILSVLNDMDLNMAGRLYFLK